MTVKAFTGQLDQPKVKPFTGQLDKASQEEIDEVSARFDDPLMSSIEGVDTDDLAEKGIIKPGGRNVGKLVAENAPMIGATAASMMFPPAALPAALSKVPVASKFLSELAFKLPAAAAGGGLGGLFKGATQEGATVQSTLKTGLEGAKDMAVAEVTGAGLGMLASKILKPAGEILDKSLVEFAKKNKIPILPSRLTGGNVSNQILEGGSDAILGGRLLNTFYRKKMITTFNKMADDISKSQGAILGNNVIAPQARKEFVDVVAATESQAKALATNFINSVPPTVKISNLKPLLNKVLKQAKSPALKRFVNDELEQISGKSVKSAENLETTMRQISGIRAKGADAKFLTEMREAIKKDFESAGGNMELLKQSSEFFKNNRALLGSSTARRLKQSAGRPGAIPDRGVTVEIFKSGNEGLVKELEKNLTPETWASLKAQNIANLLDGATKDVPEMFGTKFLDGAKLEKIIENNKTVFEKVYGKEFLKTIGNMAKLAKSASPEINQLAGKGTFAGIKNVAALGSTAGAAIDPFTGIILPQGGSLALSQSLMNPNGILKAWLTTGIPDKAVKEGLKLGTRAVFDGNQ